MWEGEVVLKNYVHHHSLSGKDDSGVEKFTPRKNDKNLIADSETLNFGWIQEYRRARGV